MTVEDSKRSKTINYICHIFAVVAQKPVKLSYRAALQFALWQSFIKYTAKGQGWYYGLCKPDPCLHRPQPLSLTSGALRPLSLQHLISPLNLRLTRSFSSKGLPLCLQPSSTNGAWKGIEERWRVAVSVVVRRKNQPRGEKESWVRSVTLPEACGREGHPGWGNAGVDVYAVGWEPLFGCWHCHVPLIAFLHHLWLKLMGHPCCWVAYYQFIYQMGWGCLSGPFVARTLTVLEQTSAQLWGKVSTSGPNKWYGLNGRGNDFYPSSLIWPRGWWWDGGDILFYNFTPGHYLDLILL